MRTGARATCLPSLQMTKSELVFPCPANCISPIRFSNMLLIKLCRQQFSVLAPKVLVRHPVIPRLSVHPSETTDTQPYSKAIHWAEEAPVTLQQLGVGEHLTNDILVDYVGICRELQRSIEISYFRRTESVEFKYFGVMDKSASHLCGNPKSDNGMRKPTMLAQLEPSPSFQLSIYRPSRFTRNLSCMTPEGKVSNASMSRLAQRWVTSID